MKYCKKCILPDTRPGLVIEDDGICNACHNFMSRPQIDYDEREKLFANIAADAKKRSHGYDCLIPASGGKDSTWQLVKCLEYGLKPLIVTWCTPGRTAIGQANLDNMIALGADHIDYTINPKVEKKFMHLAYERYGSTGIPMHMAIFNIPATIAVRFNIPLIVWGENSAFEYGSSDPEIIHGFKLDQRWFKKFGVTHGTSAKDWISDELSQKDLTAYFGPDDAELEKKKINAVFLGYYFSWDVETSLAVAQQHGFKRSMNGAKTGLYDYTDIDCDFISIHHYLKWYKFGFTRLFDNLSLEIRNGRISRDDALQILRNKGNQQPLNDIKALCKFLNMSLDEFFNIAETFRNHDIWYKDGNTWKIKNFILPDWNWEESNAM